MSDPNPAAMLTLAALTYRGFHDVLPGEPHEVIVRHAVDDGLRRLAPVRNDWKLVWGPATSRLPLGVFDSSAMYVAQHRHEGRRYVVAVRGTNPVASSDWLFGDLWVATTMPWPYGNNGAAISMSTALGLVSLQAMRSRPASVLARFAEAALARAAVSEPISRLLLAGRATVSGIAEKSGPLLSSLEAQLSRIVETWQADPESRDRLLTGIQRAADTLHLLPSDLRPRWQAAADSRQGVDLLSFLREEAIRPGGEPLEVTVTGHSKGAALAQAVAMWLQDALGSVDPTECWDASRRARVSCYAFAGPTAGNAAFAKRIDERLRDRHHHIRNTNDVVTHAWQSNELTQLPALYDHRTAPFASLVGSFLATVGPLNYRQPTAGVTTFTGALQLNRSLALEIVHQHLEAYLDHLGLLSPELNAVTFFI